MADFAWYHEMVADLVDVAMRVTHSDSLVPIEQDNEERLELDRAFRNVLFEHLPRRISRHFDIDLTPPPPGLYPPP